MHVYIKILSAPKYLSYIEFINLKDLLVWEF